MTNYKAILVNTSGCIFESIEDTNIKRIRSWAIGRGDDYTLEVYLEDSELHRLFKCQGNRSYEQC